MSKEELADLIIKGHTARVWMPEYTLEKMLDILGDGERFEELRDMMLEQDFSERINVERARLQNEAGREKKSVMKQLDKERQARVEKEKESALLTREIEDIISS